MNQNIEDLIYEEQVSQWIGFLRTTITSKDFVYRALSRFVKWKTVQERPGVKWGEFDLLVNPHITWDIIQSNKEFFFGSEDLEQDDLDKCLESILGPKSLNQEAEFLRQFSYNPNLTMDIVMENPHVKWDYDYIATLPIMDWERVRNAPDHPFCSYELGTDRRSVVNKRQDNHDRNPTLEDVMNDPTNYQNWYEISRSSNITEDDIKNNDYLPWKWIGLSSNPNITWKYIEKHIRNPWDECNLANNPFTHQLELVRKEFIERFGNEDC